MSCIASSVLAEEIVQARLSAPPASSKTEFSPAFKQQALQKNIPLSLLQLRSDYQHVLAVDLSSNQIFVFANNNGTPKLINSYYATIGKEGFGKQREGDNRTPVGVYRTQKYIDGKSLPELYGHGALPLDFPNAWDRKQGRTGHGIWIHGMPSNQSRRPPRDSEGCVVVSNELMPVLHHWSELKSTPVILADKLQWVEPVRADKARTALLSTVEEWRNNWASGDMDKFLAMHSPKFRTQNQRFTNYANRKRKFAQARGSVGIRLEDIEVFMYPDVDHKAMAMVSFRQHYSSKQFKDTSHKTQYWQYDGNHWVLQLERNALPWLTQKSNSKPVTLAKAKSNSSQRTDR